MRVQDYNTLDLQEGDPICVGISTMTGPQILQGIRFAKDVRRVLPHTPIIWGGIHPSLVPEQVILEEYVDIVVYGEGELTLLELVQKLESGELLDNVQGIVYKKNGGIRKNPAREWIDLNTMGTLPYHLIDMTKYDDWEFSYQSSRGCPHNCGFCYNRVFNKQSFRVRKSELVLEDLDYIINKFKPRLIAFEDDNFFTDAKRVEQICKGIVARNMKLSWYSTCRVDYLNKSSSEFSQLVRDSGCLKLMLGAESGSSRILEQIDKDIDVEQIITAVKRCKEVGVAAVLGFMGGFPGETSEDINMTLELIDEIKRLYNKAYINGFFIFTPFPHTPMTDSISLNGYKGPSTLEEWGHLEWGRNVNYPWIEKSRMKELTTISDIVRFNYIYEFGFNNKLKNKVDLIPFVIMGWLYSLSARIRWKFRYFKCPIEWQLWSWIRYKYLGFH
jgi:radical SAM superfamily enzyme YgiQ (UPF0313 family)